MSLLHCCLVVLVMTFHSKLVVKASLMGMSCTVTSAVSHWFVNMRLTLSTMHLVSLLLDIPFLCLLCAQLVAHSMHMPCNCGGTWQSCRGRQTANTLESNKRCEKAETDCEDSLEREQGSTLPSTGRFEDRFSQCQANFDRLCIGPAHTGQVCHRDKQSNWREWKGQGDHGGKGRGESGVQVQLYHWEVVHPPAVVLVLPILDICVVKASTGISA